MKQATKKTKEKRKIIKWEVLRKRMHEIAIKTPEYLVERRVLGSSIIIIDSREKWIELYGLAEESLLDEIGPFWIIDEPEEPKDFTWSKDVLAIKKNGEEKFQPTM